MNVDSSGEAAARGKDWVKWANCGVEKMLTYCQLCDNGFKKYEKKCKFLQSETLISHSILLIEQVEIMATDY